VSDLWTLLALAGAALAALPALLFARNLKLYRPPMTTLAAGGVVPRVSVLIPARDEERTIGGAVAAALASRGVEIEVVVLDDGSRDRTAAVVDEIARRDHRLRLETAPPLPTGWCGKQHACAVLAERAAAGFDLLAFVDADVRLAPDGLARAVAFLEESGADLVSGFPRQETGSFLERLLLPLMHFLLLGFLPLARMRQSRHPSYGAGCGQLFLVRRAAYSEAGGHGAIRSSLHDGVKLPRALRRAGFATDLFDATEVASCRMYRGAGEVWRGLSKNATEGVAAPAAIVPFTLLLAGGQVLPPALLLAALVPLVRLLPVEAVVLAALGTVAGLVPRLAATRRFRQPLAGALLHPLAIAVFLVLQWTALLRQLAGRPAGWKGRRYPRPAGPGRTTSAPAGQPPRRNASAAGKNS
jgi:hypothetical protein